MLKLTDYMLRVSNFKNNGTWWNLSNTNKTIEKGLSLLPNCFFFVFLFFQNMVKTHEEINIGIMNNT